MAALAHIHATRVIGASPEAIFGFLAELENHWKLAARWVEPLSIADGGGEVCIHGPLGLRRTARTVVVDATPSAVLHGTAELSGGTLAQVAWHLSEDAAGTAVRLSARVQRATHGDRMLLMLGGVAWMRHRFATILEQLDAEVRQLAEPHARAMPAASRVQVSTES